MDSATIQRLNQINRDFYTTTATEFDQTRGQAWPGWAALLPHLDDSEAAGPLRVLDVGCGNGRFGVYLAESLARPIDYTGLDNNPALLAFARSSLGEAGLASMQCIEQDIVTDPPSGQYDLVALFGVIHHIPGAAARQAFMQALAGCVAPGGTLAFASWRFYEYERFRQRVVPWPDDIAVEKHDYLLDWRRGERALRYCHYVDDAEQHLLEGATGLSPVGSYRADGFSGAVNAYSILKYMDFIMLH